MNINKILFNDKGREIPNELRDFNWGAFLLTFIWGIKYKIWFTLLIIPLFLIKLPYNLNWLALLIFQLYCGINGNKWAYQEDFWKKPKDFRIIQMKWAAFALTFNIIIPLALLTITAKFLKKPENLGEIVRSSLCVNTQNVLNETLPKMIISKDQSGLDIANKFAKFYPNSKIENNVVSTKLKKIKNTNVKIHFEKEADTLCEISNRNCKIYSFYDIPEQYGLTKNCVFYLGNNKKIMPDSQTQKAISKGNNIFKYLQD